MKIGLGRGYGDKEFSCGYFVFERPVTQPGVFKRHLEIRAWVSERDTGPES